MMLFPSEIDAGLDRLARRLPAAAARARRAVRVLLEPVLHSRWPEIAWQGSTLTGDGFPFEFSFSSSDDEVRYAVEFAPPESRERDRLARGLTMLRSLGVPEIEAATADRLRQLQGHLPLRYGAFIGGRHDGAADRFKLYVEVPDGCCCPSLPRLTGVCATPVMVGYQPHSGRTEWYYRAAALSVEQLTVVAAAAGVSDGCPDLIRLIESVWRRPVRHVLPGRHLGFSLSILPDRPGALSVFNYASSLFVTDRAVRDCLLQVAAANHWPFEHYEQVTRRLHDHQPATMAHTMVTYSVRDRGSVSLHIGVRPVP